MGRLIFCVNLTELRDAQSTGTTSFQCARELLKETGTCLRGLRAKKHYAHHSRVATTQLTRPRREQTVKERRVCSGSWDISLFLLSDITAPGSWAFRLQGLLQVWSSGLQAWTESYC